MWIGTENAEISKHLEGNIVKVIYVPMESVNAYKTASYWSKYNSSIVGYNF